MANFLEINNISKDFYPVLTFKQLLGLKFKRKKQIRALEDISFSLEKGKILAILGPNGAGKTTLLKIISTLILPDKGTFTVNGYCSPRDEEKIKSSVGLILDEERSFYWRLTGRQNLEFFAGLYGFNKRGSDSRIIELLELFKIDYADKRFDSYSSGMKKRFALMRGLLHNPQLILMDEPTKSLDYTAAYNLRNFIKENLVKKHAKTVIFTTHHMDEALDFADLFMILHKGKSCGIGTLNDLRRKINNQEAGLDRIFLELTKEA